MVMYHNVWNANTISLPLPKPSDPYQSLIREGTLLPLTSLAHFLKMRETTVSLPSQIAWAVTSNSLQCTQIPQRNNWLTSFFDKWYCENGLPSDIISDRDKLFVSKFWKVPHKITGVKLKMSTAYHLQADSASEHTNKTVNQCLQYHVEQNQLGWVCALPSTLQCPTYSCRNPVIPLE